MRREFGKTENYKTMQYLLFEKMRDDIVVRCVKTFYYLKKLKTKTLILLTSFQYRS